LSAVNPFAFEKFKKEQIAKRLRKETEGGRINIKKTEAKSNRDYERELEELGKDKTKKKQAA
jgi:hypothetical protein